MVDATATREALVATYGASQRRAVLQTSITVERLWKELDGADLSGSWTAGLGQAVVRAVTAGQFLAASTGQTYVNAVSDTESTAEELAAGDDVAGQVSARALAGVAADGRALDSLLYLPVIRTKTLLSGGLTLQESMLGGLMDLRRMAVSEVADAGRGAASVAMVANRRVVGYIRMIRPGACARCAILAGRWYRYSADFQRHKNCQCYGTPARRGATQGITDPREFFDGLSPAEQDRRFTAAGAQAIRDGADMSQVVNARRGMTTVDAFGRRVEATLEGTTKRGEFYQQVRAESEARTGIRFARGAADIEQGLPSYQLRTPRLMPAEIYKLTSDRTELIRLLTRFGYLK